MRMLVNTSPELLNEVIIQQHCIQDISTNLLFEKIKHKKRWELSIKDPVFSDTGGSSYREYTV